jgi:hypothetical protein
VADAGVSVAYEKMAAWSVDYDALHSVSVIGGFDPVLFAPLQRDQAFDAVAVSSPDATRLADVAREHLAQRHEPGNEWWDSPTADLGIALWPVGLLLRPPSSPMPQQHWCTVSFVNTGIQMRTARHPKYPSMYAGDVRAFLPWSTVHDVSVEGSDQIERRPSVAAVVAFGILGLGASKSIRRSYLVVSADEGDYVFERQEMLPLELSGYLAPVLRQMRHVAAGDDPLQQLLEAQLETNRLLSLILEEISGGAHDAETT